MQRNYIGNTKGLPRKCKGNAKGIQRKMQRKYKGNTKETPRKYQGNTKEHKGSTLWLKSIKTKDNLDIVAFKLREALRISLEILGNS